MLQYKSVIRLETLADPTRPTRQDGAVSRSDSVLRVLSDVAPVKCLPYRRLSKSFGQELDLSQTLIFDKSVLGFRDAFHSIWFCLVLMAAGHSVACHLLLRRWVGVDVVFKQRRVSEFTTRSHVNGLKLTTLFSFIAAQVCNQRLV